jgi:hypothetical protein
MDINQIEELAHGCGMTRTSGDLIKPMWVASTGQLNQFASVIIHDLKQNASEYMIRAIKKAVEYERAECAKLSDYAGDKELSKRIRERGNDD